MTDHTATLRAIDEIVGNELTLDDAATTLIRGLLFAALSTSHRAPQTAQNPPGVGQDTRAGELVNQVEGPGDAARRLAHELCRLSEGLTDQGIALDPNESVDTAPVTTALRQISQLAYERRLLGAARRILDLVAAGDPHRWDAMRREAEDVAQRIVDEIGHPATDEPALGPNLRAEVQRLTQERDEARAEVKQWQATYGEPALTNATHYLNIAVAARRWREQFGKFAATTGDSRRNALIAAVDALPTQETQQ